MGFSEWIELNIYLLLWLKIIFNLFYIKKKFNKIYKMDRIFYLLNNHFFSNFVKKYASKYIFNNILIMEIID